MITSVNRDDLADGGAAHWAATIRAVRRHAPALPRRGADPGLPGSSRRRSRPSSTPAPDILNHNTETVPRLYKVARHGGRYERTLELFRHARAAAPGARRRSRASSWASARRGTSSIATMRDLREVGVAILTLGQYLRPSARTPAGRRSTTIPTSSRSSAEIGPRARASRTSSRARWSAAPITPRSRPIGRLRTRASRA